MKLILTKTAQAVKPAGAVKNDSVYFLLNLAKIQIAYSADSPTSA